MYEFAGATKANVRAKFRAKIRGRVDRDRFCVSYILPSATIYDLYPGAVNIRAISLAERERGSVTNARIPKKDAPRTAMRRFELYV